MKPLVAKLIEDLSALPPGESITICMSELWKNGVSITDLLDHVDRGQFDRCFNTETWTVKFTRP